MSMLFAETLKRLRMKKEISQRELAERIGEQLNKLRYPFWTGGGNT